MKAMVCVLRCGAAVLLACGLPVAAMAAQDSVSGSMAPADFVLVGSARQGGVMTGRAPDGAAAVRFNDMALPLADDGTFLIAFDRDAPAGATLTAVMPDGREVTRSLSVAAGQWRLEHVNADMRGGAASDADYQRRRAAELARIKAAQAMPVVSDGWRQGFVWPMKGRRSGQFGAQRIYRGKPGSYHSGSDVAGPVGAPYAAPADGVVLLAAQDDFTLEGKLLILGHGMGLTSAFLHSSALLVKEGDVVRQGQIIGRVGASGRASGPHLHWGMKWHAARIDPSLLAGPM